LDQHSATLFVQTSQAAMQGAIAMPHDPNREWLPLHSTSRINRGDYDSYISTFPLKNIQQIAQGELFAQLAGGHYFLFPILPNEHINCEQALLNLALNMWDSVHGKLTETVIYPDGYHDDSPVERPKITDTMKEQQTVGSLIYSALNKRTMKDKNSQRPITSNQVNVITATTPTKPIRKLLQSNDPTNRQPETGTPELINRCFGKDQHDQLRLSLGILSTAQIDTIRSLQQQTTKAEFHKKLFQLLCSDQQYRIRYWKQVQYDHWNDSIPDGACGWYTISNLIQRANQTPILNHRHPADRLKGVEILAGIANKIQGDTQQHRTLLNATQWIKSPTQETSLRMNDQLSSGDFSTYLADIYTALLTEPTSRTTQMTTPNWLQLLNHTATDTGNTLPTLLDLLRITTAGNIAILKEHHYWLYPLLQDEDDKCLYALFDLSNRIWEVCEGIYPSQLLTAPAHWSTWVDDEIQLATSQKHKRNGKASTSAHSPPGLTTEQDSQSNFQIASIEGTPMEMDSQGYQPHPLRKDHDGTPIEDPNGTFTPLGPISQSSPLDTVVATSRQDHIPDLLPSKTNAIIEMEDTSMEVDTTPDYQPQLTLNNNE
jgi:hypothetical protein